MRPRAVSFDFGQTLAELSEDMLAERVAERGAHVGVSALRQASDAAWQAYADAKRNGLSGQDAWSTFMRCLLVDAGVKGSRPTQQLASELTEWLWTEQPRRNLWRRLVPGMLELVDELGRGGVPVAILSNSEGHLSELVHELGLSDRFRAVVDSGRLGFEKPDPRIFRHTAHELGIDLTELVHIGDSWEADIEGALAVGAFGVWYSREEPPVPLPASSARAATPEEARQVLSRLGLVLGG